ncbi:MAG: glycosyltransferase family 2 protein [Candidatus Woesearchaeota archaeon]
MSGISFLIVNYHTAECITLLVDSIKENIHKYVYEILIYDNSCTLDQTTKLLSLRNNTIKVYFSEENIGFVRANNFLLKQAQYEIIILINPDTKLIDNSLEHLLDMIQSSHGIGAVGPMLLNDDNSYQVSFFKFPNLITLIQEHILLFRDPYSYSTDHTTQQECDVIRGACLVFKKECLKENYIFDEDYVMFSEEVDLCWRLKKQGFKNYYYPFTKIIHYGGKSSNRKEISDYVLYHYYRSKLIFFKKHHSRLYYTLVKCVLIISLIEKVILLFIVLKTWNSIRHYKVLKTLLNEFKNGKI